MTDMLGVELTEEMVAELQREERREISFNSWGRITGALISLTLVAGFIIWLASM